MMGACARFLVLCLCIGYPAAALAAVPADPALPDRNPQRQVDKAAADTSIVVAPSETNDPTATVSPDATESAPEAAANDAEKTESVPEPPKAVVKLDPTLANPARNPKRLPSGSENGPPSLDAKKVLATLLDYPLSSSDAGNLQEAVRAAYSGNGPRASAAIGRIKDESARKLATWYYYRSSGMNAPAWNIERFRVEHPDWPSQDMLRQRAEESLFLSKASPRAIKAFFRRTAPTTGAGKAALGWALLQRGDKEAAKELVRGAWREHHFEDKVEKEILSRFDDLLDADDHRGRIDRLLYTDRKSETAAARRIAKLLPEDEQKKVEARIAVINRGNNAGKLLDALPADAVKSDLGLRFNRIQWLRRQSERREEAWKLLLDTPNPDRLLDLNEWWVERRINIRGALNDGNPKIAYEIAKNRGPLTGGQYAEAEFLAGWIALRFLRDPETALKHFVGLRTGATDAKLIARAEYWLGRASLARGDALTAAQHFRAAARYPQHYYGQLGRQALDGEMADLEVMPPPLPTQEHIDRFLARHSVRAIGVAMKAGLDNLTPPLFLQLARTLESGEEAALLAELAYVTDKRQLSIRLAKIAFNRDLPVGYYALPIGVLPDFKSLAEEPVDLALVHALSRQESEFNPKAQSPVGARGLMQLMPATARMVARQYKVAYQQSALTADPSYNVRLGEAHLCDLLNNYDGSYILTLVAYNAGPGRVRDWVAQFGDPRHPDVDPIDWVERIPFTETRDYVFKIMESMQLYRARLAGPQQSLRLWHDLHRGSKVMPARQGVMVDAQATAN